MTLPIYTDADDAYANGVFDGELAVRAQLTDPIDTIEDELSKAWLTEPARLALEALVRFRDAAP